MDVAKKLNINTNKVYELVNDGKILYKRKGKGYVLFDKDYIDNLVDPYRVYFDDCVGLKQAAKALSMEVREIKEMIRKDMIKSYSVLGMGKRVNKREFKHIVDAWTELQKEKSND